MTRFNEGLNETKRGKYKTYIHKDQKLRGQGSICTQFAKDFDEAIRQDNTVSTKQQPSPLLLTQTAVQCSQHAVATIRMKYNDEKVAAEVVKEKVAVGDAEVDDEW